MLNDFKKIRLSSGQAKFALMIEPYPRISVYWNWEARECAPEAIELALPSMSHQEQIMMMFFWSVWTHENKGFNFIEAASILDSEHMEIITNWMNNPFWP